MKYLLFFILIITLSCKNKTSKKYIPLLKESNIDRGIQEGLWTQYSSKDSIPTILTNRLNELSGHNFELANAKDPYQSTDLIINKELPARQLRYLGNNKSFWIMTYKHGGIGLHYHLIICQIIESDIKLFSSGTSMIDLETITEIKQAMSNQKISYNATEL